MRLKRASLIGAAVAFARSPRGQEMLSQARQKYDTPQNRAKLRETVDGLRRRPSR
ncbi:MAG: hypothetical protein JWN35_1870 [Frankiales bacterium]|jgi:hypothetical protein|nr:hypothetical protein [Frankiales bacterium]